MGTDENEISDLIEQFGGDKSHYKDEIPQHKVDLAAFRMARTPVSNAQYALFVQSAGT